MKVVGKTSLTFLPLVHTEVLALMPGTSPSRIIRGVILGLSGVDRSGGTV